MHAEDHPDVPHFTHTAHNIFVKSNRRHVEYNILNFYIYIRLRKKTLVLAVFVPAAPFRSMARGKVRYRSLADGQTRSPRTHTLLGFREFRHKYRSLDI
jgi:hypothetical protein